MLRKFSGDAKGMLRGCSGDSQGMLRGCSGDAQGMLRGCSGDAQEMLRGFSGDALKSNCTALEAKSLFSLVFSFNSINCRPAGRFESRTM
jgi:hypothetical protein